MKLLMLIIPILSFVISGCVEQKSLENLGLVTAIGYDRNKEEAEEVEGTLAVLQFSPEKQSVSNIFSASSITSKGVKRKINYETSKKIASGQLRVAIYGDEIASEGLSQYVDTLTRDASIGNMVYLAVASPTAKEILNHQDPYQTDNIGTYLYNMIRQNIDRELIPNPTLQEYLRTFYDIGKDPVLPLLTIENGHIVISGLALFNDDHYLAPLPQDDIFYLRMLMEKYTRALTEIDLPRQRFKAFFTENQTENPTYKEKKEDVHLTLDNIHAHEKITMTEETGRPIFSIHVKTNLRVLEVSETMDLGDPAVVRKLETEISKKMEKKMNELSAMLKEKNTDPIGFGNYYMARHRSTHLTKQQWMDIYKNSKINVTVETSIQRTGVID
ncbi:Ger(x)C family spore germination protein [Falsibacillus pallidus]|uniref:Ger(x)C family spore germination protein n=1 Tax=Falsibacillus pallidus TaxID=493781 RepID=UPI003D95EB12